MRQDQLSCLSHEYLRHAPADRHDRASRTIAPIAVRLKPICKPRFLEHPARHCSGSMANGHWILEYWPMVIMSMLWSHVPWYGLPMISCRFRRGRPCRILVGTHGKRCLKSRSSCSEWAISTRAGGFCRGVARFPDCGFITSGRPLTKFPVLPPGDHGNRHQYTRFGLPATIRGNLDAVDKMLRHRRRADHRDLPR